MSKVNVAPAFPTLEAHGFNCGTPGMTMRDYFAAKAMQSMIEKCGQYDPVKESKTHKSVAEIAYQFADAMLLERAK